MAKQRLTDLGVKAAKAKGPRTDIWDSECAGLVLRVTSGGRKSWYLFYRHGGKKRRTVLGGANEGAMGLAEARKLARERRDVALGGDDPAAALKAGRPRTVAELIERYGNSAEARRKRTWPEERRILAKDVAPVIGKIELEKLRKADVLTVVERVAERGANRTADRTVRILSAILNWAVDDDLMAANPAQRIRRRAAVANPRERVLSASELRHLWQGLPAIYSDVQRQLMVKLILLTGCRKMEVQAARADELALAGEEPRWIIPGDRTKNRRTHTVPLSKTAAAVVTEALGIAGGSKLLFPAPSNGEVFDEGVLNKGIMRAFRNGATRERAQGTGLYLSLKRGPLLVSERAASEPYTIHDLRRTVAAQLKEMGISPDVRKAILNHAPQGVTAIHYEGGADMLPQMRLALEAWAGRLATIVEGRISPTNVVSFAAIG